MLSRPPVILSRSVLASRPWKPCQALGVSCQGVVKVEQGGVVSLDPHHLIFESGMGIGCHSRYVECWQCSRLAPATWHREKSWGVPTCCWSRRSCRLLGTCACDPFLSSRLCSCAASKEFFNPASGLMPSWSLFLVPKMEHINLYIKLHKPRLHAV